MVRRCKVFTRYRSNAPARHLQPSMRKYSHASQRLQVVIMMMGANDDDALTVNLDMDQTGVIEAPDDTEAVGETGSDLSPSSPEAMMREVANDATASIEYVHQFPRAFGQLHVEAAFQAQYTETRLTYVAYTFVGCFVFFFGGALFDLINSVCELGSQPTGTLPLSLRLGLCAMFLLASLGLLCNQTKLRHHHDAVQALSNFAMGLFFVACTGLTLRSLKAEHPYEFGTGYISGLVLAGGTFVVAHTEASLRIFLLNAIFGVSVWCASAARGNDSALIVIIVSIAGAVILGSISRQIMLQHRHSFAAQVRHRVSL